MNKVQWSRHTYRVYVQEKKRKQDEFNAVALRMAHQELVEQRLIENALKAANWVEKQARKQPASAPQGSIAGWLLPIG